DVVAFPPVHDGFRAPLGPRAEALGFVIEGTSRVYFAGDTDPFPAMATLRGTTDVALLPVWDCGPYLGPAHLAPRRPTAAPRTAPDEAPGPADHPARRRGAGGSATGAAPGADARAAPAA